MNSSHITFPPQPQLLERGGVSKPKKLRRISRACDFCHNRSIRCQPSKVEGDASKCQNCIDFAVRCTYDRPAKKRGVKSGRSSENGGSRDGESDARMLLELTNGTKSSIPGVWKGEMEGYGKEITDLVEVYFEIVYPIFPLFHYQSVVRRLAANEHLTNQSFFAGIMAICALASARARGGALFPGHWDPKQFQTPSSEFFFAAATEVIPQDLSKLKGLDWMRTCTLLALYGIQVGKIDVIYQYLYIYHSLVSIDGLHDEKNWPKDIGIVEIELRRRLFWSTYSLEVYSSIVWGSITRCREAQCHVSYPSEVDDENFSDTGYNPQNSFMTPQQTITNPNCWLHGWNFTTELYRILEHAMDELHLRRLSNIGSVSLSDLFRKRVPHKSVVLDKVTSMYEELPAQFKGIKSMPQNGKGGPDDKIGFQVTNITATFHLLRMILFTSEEATIDQKCAITRDLLDSFAKIPIVFLRASSSPLFHQSAAIGSILGSEMEEPLSESSHLQVREVLLAMADFLSSLETGITHTVGASSRLRNQIAIIDNYRHLSAQRQPDFASTPYTPSVPAPAPHPHPPRPFRLKQEPNPNIDPSLQNAGLPTGGSAAAGFIENVYGFVPQSVGLNGNEIGVVAGEERFQMRVPPELEGFPLGFDIGQRLGQIPS